MAELRVKSTGTLKLFENDNTSSVTIASPASLGADRTVTLPDADVTLVSGTMSTGFAVADITGQTALGATPADTDEFVLSDAGVLKRVDFSYMSNTPAFAVGKSAIQTISSSTATKVTFDTEYFDSDGAFASDKFTCPSGGDGKYLMAMKPYFQGYNNLVKSYSMMPYMNGAAIDYGNTLSATTSDQQLNTTYATGVSASSTFIVTLAATDYVECYANITTADASDPQVYALYTSWSGYKLIGV